MENKKIQDFKDLKAWQEGHRLAILVYEITENFPHKEMYSLVDQMRRAVVSVTSNIAEGFGRHSYKEKANFYKIAQGSLAELENQTLLAKDIGYIDTTLFNNFEVQLKTTQKLLGGLISKTKSFFSPSFHSNLKSPVSNLSSKPSSNSNLRSLIPVLFLVSSLYSLFSPYPADAFTLSKSSNNLLGLVGWWTFDGKDMANGVALDMSGRFATGSPMSIATSTFYSGGKIGQALNFDAVNDRVLVGDPADGHLDFGEDNFSISFWVYRDPNATTNLRSLAKGANDDTEAQAGYAFFASDSQMTFIINPTAVRVSANTGAVMKTRTWHHIVGTVNRAGTTMSIYLDGVWKDDTTIPASGSVSSSNNFNIGSTATPSVYWDGKIDDVRVYNRLLSATEIRQLYNQGTAKVNVTPKDPFTSGLVGWWTFDGKNMYQNVADTSGNGNNGSLKLGSTGNTSTTTSSGKIGQGLVFDGMADDYVIIPHTVIDGKTNVSYSFWIKTANSSGSQAVISGANAGNNNEVLVFFGSNTRLDFYTGTGSAHTLSWTIPALSNSGWHHFGVVRDQDNSVVRAYRDGVLISPGDRATTTTALSIDSGGLLFGQEQDTVGGGFDATQSLDGTLDDVRVYSRALSAAEITQLYAQGQSKQNASKNNSLTSGLVGLWSFDGKDTLGGTIYDRSGNGNNGSAVNISTSTFYTAGKIGQALRFFGGSDLINLPNSSVFNPGGAFSACGWLYSNVEGQAARAAISQTDSADKATYKWIAGYVTTNSTAIQSYVRIGGTVHNVSKSSSALAKSWHHFCSTFDRTLSSARLKIYVDGVLGDSDNAADGDIDSGDYPTIADWGATGASFIGKIDDVRIYSRALSASEILQLYNLGR